MKTSRVQVALTLLLAAAATVSALSIENEQPVKVTHRNSGPRYDIGEIERARALLKESASRTTLPPPPAERPEGEQEGEQAPTVGHIALRRIFLFPIMRPQAGDEQPLGGNSGREHEDSSEQTPRVPMMMAKPLWPFMMPARPSPGQTGQPTPDADNEHNHDERPHIIRHLFGADEASRSPDMDRAASSEHDQSRQQPMPPHGAAAFDPIQMMMDMLHQAISGQMGREFAKDLNKDQAESARPTGGDNSPAESSDERPTMPQVLSMRPGSQNETREDIVEIEGRKYVRKTLINRHVGDNLVFMTRRLIFIPLNETTEEPTETQTGGAVTTTTTTTTTTTELPPSSTSGSDERPTPSSARAEDKPKSETPESSSPATTTNASEQPTPAAPEVAEQTTPSSTSAVEPVTSTTAATEPAKSESAPESKAAERLVEAGASESNSASKSENEKEKEAPKANLP